MWGVTFLFGTVYLSGVVLYSALFIYSSNQAPYLQTAKIFIAGAHALFLILPVVLAQSRLIVLKVLGYGIITAYFFYAVFLVGYFPYFGFIPELYAFDFGSVHDLADVANHYIKQLFGWRELALVTLFVMLVWQIRNTQLPRFSLSVIAVPVLLLALSFYSFGGVAHSESYGNVTILRRFGPVVFSYASLSEWLGSRGGYLAEKTDYPGRVAELIAEEDQTPRAFISEIPKVSRVIIIQIESFDVMAIDARLSNIQVMPFVSKLRDTCLNYQNFFTMKGAGGSSDAEFSIATGLVPSARLPSLKRIEFSDIETLYQQLKANGIASSFSHNNQSGFYGRHKAYAQIDEIETYFLEPRKTVSETEFARDNLKNALQSSEKILHYFFNFKSHGPYQGYSKATREIFSIKRSEDIRNDYLATMHEVDQMISDMFALQENGFEQGENLFILLADHPSYLHVTDDELSRFRIPAMICHRNFDGVEIANIFGTIDLHSTILEAFGLNVGQHQLGQSMFWDVHNAVLLPQRQIIYHSPAGRPQLIPCQVNCDVYFNFTEQHMRF